MTFLPVVERELRIAARRPATRWLRFYAVLAVIGLGLLLLMANQPRLSGPMIGRMLFGVLSSLALVFSLLAGVFLTADCVCSEKREGTLGLLFLTDLKGFDVVLGKLAATSLVAVYTLLGVLPMLGLPLLMGGVSGGEFFRTITLLVVTVLLSLSTGLLFSTVCRKTRTAMLGSFTALALLNAVLPLLALASGSQQIMLPAPVYAFVQAANPTLSRSLGVSWFWISTFIIAALAVAQLVAASLILPRVWQEKDAGEKPQPEAFNAVEAEIVHGAKSGARAAQMDSNPYSWVLSSDPFPGPKTRLLLLLLFLGWAWLFAAGWLSNSFTMGVMMVLCVYMTFGLHLFVKLLVAFHAGHRLGEDRRSGALELLLVTPLSPRQIVEAQWRALQRQFRLLIILLMAMNVALLFRMLTETTSRPPAGVMMMFAFVLLGGAALLVLDFKALAWMTMASAVRGIRPHRVALSALARVVVIPWGIFTIFMFLNVGGGFSTEGFVMFYVVWFVISAVISISAARTSRQQLEQHFRAMAAGQYHKPAGGVISDSSGVVAPLQN